MIRHLTCALYLILYFLFSPTPTQEQPKADPLAPPAPLEIQESVVHPAKHGSPSAVIVTLHNRSGLAPITQIRIRVETIHDLKIEEKVEAIAPGESSSLRFIVPPNSGHPYLVAEYTWDGRTYSVAKAVATPTVPKVDSSWSLFIPSVITAFATFLGAILGAWLIHRFTSRREQVQNKQAWSSMLFEKYEPAYLEFKNGWGQTASSTVLEQHFRKLRSATLVMPESIIKAYEETQKILANETTTGENKQQACRDFQLKIDSFLLEPWQK